jgi:hypothetical protein
LGLTIFQQANIVVDYALKYTKLIIDSPVVVKNLQSLIRVYGKNPLGELPGTSE